LEKRRRLESKAGSRGGGNTKTVSHVVTELEAKGTNRRGAKGGENDRRRGGESRGVSDA